MAQTDAPERLKFAEAGSLAVVARGTHLSADSVGGLGLCAVKLSAILDGKVLPRAPIEGAVVLGAELRAAAYIGDVDAVLALIRQGAHPCDPDDEGFTAIHIAAQEGHEYLASVLLEHPCVNANVNVESRSRITPLHSACAHGQVQVALVLLKHGADHEARASAGETPLYRAVFMRHLEVVIALLDGDLGVPADVNAVADDGTTILMCAAESGSIDIVCELLRAGADPRATQPGPEGGVVTALDFAKRAHDQAVIDVLRTWVELLARPDVQGEGDAWGE